MIDPHADNGEARPAADVRSLARLAAVPGFVGACLCNVQTGEIEGLIGDNRVPWPQIWAAHHRVLQRVSTAVGRSTDATPLEEMLLTLGDRRVFSRRRSGPSPSYLLLLIEGAAANPAVARYELTRAAAP